MKKLVLIVISAVLLCDNALANDLPQEGKQAAESAQECMEIVVSHLLQGDRRLSFGAAIALATEECATELDIMYGFMTNAKPLMDKEVWRIQYAVNFSARWNGIPDEYRKE